MHIPANALIDTAGLTPHTKPVRIEYAANLSHIGDNSLVTFPQRDSVKSKRSVRK
jgi:hypothetical protein